MEPKRVYHKCENFKIDSNELVMVDYLTYNPNYDNRM